MPFTFSHPAFIIPLKRLPSRYISMTGLVAGSVAPDFEKFIKMSSGNVYSHTLLGIFWFNLPLALALAFIFHLVVRNVLINNLPRFFRERVVRFKSFNWISHFKRNPGTVAVSILFGAFLHIVLDSFTHRDAPLLEYFPVLLEWYTFGPFWAIGSVTLMWVVMLDLSFSVGGLLFILYSFVRLPTEPVMRKESGELLKFWTLVLVIAFVTVALKLTFGAALKNNWQWIYIVIGAGLMGLFMASACWAKVKSS